MAVTSQIVIFMRGHIKGFLTSVLAVKYHHNTKSNAADRNGVVYVSHWSSLIVLLQLLLLTSKENAVDLKR